MEKIALINSNQQNVFKNELNLQPGQLIKARVIANTTDSTILLIGSTRITAKTDIQLSPGVLLELMVTDTNSEEILLSLQNPGITKKTSLVDLFKELGLQLTKENIKIVKKLMENKMKISDKNINFISQQLEKLPINTSSGLELIFDPSLLVAFVNQLRDSGFYTLACKKKKKEKGEGDYEINILCETEKLGTILTNINWCQTLKIDFSCSEKTTLELLKNNTPDLDKTLHKIIQSNFKITFNNILLDNLDTVEEIKDFEINGIDIII